MVKPQLFDAICQFSLELKYSRGEFDYLMRIKLLDLARIINKYLSQIRNIIATSYHANLTYLDEIRRVESSEKKVGNSRAEKGRIAAAVKTCSDEYKVMIYKRANDIEVVVHDSEEELDSSLDDELELILDLVAALEKKVMLVTGLIGELIYRELREVKLNEPVYVEYYSIGRSYWEDIWRNILLHAYARREAAYVTGIEAAHIGESYSITITTINPYISTPREDWLHVSLPVRNICKFFNHELTCLSYAVSAAAAVSEKIGHKYIRMFRSIAESINIMIVRLVQ